MMVTFVREVLQLVETAPDDEDTKKVAALAAWMVLHHHLYRWRQLLSMWNLYMRRLQLMMHLKQKVGVHYCLPRKSQLLMQHVYNEMLDLRKHFRVSKATFNFVCRMVHTPKDHGWPERLEVLVFLYWLASGAAYRVVAAKFGMPKSTVNDIIHRILGRFLTNLRQIIYLPKADEMESVTQGFARASESPALDRIAGCIDCFHVGIRPPKTLEQYYVNEKLYHSIKCQVICDHRGLVRDLFVGFPGSVHDSQVLSLSPLYTKGTFPAKGYYLFGDNAYACGVGPVNVITPFLDVASNTCEAHFNACHRKSWLIVNKTITLMKARWNRVFNQYLDASNRIAPKIVAACAMMHNITLMTGDRIIINYADSNVKMDRCTHQTENTELRKQLVKKMSAEFSTPVPLEHDYL